MTEEFEKKMQELHARYGDLSPEERRQLKEQLKRRNLFAYHRLERIKHDLLRLETKRAQLKLTGNEKELAELEKKMLLRKEDFLKTLYQHK